MNTTVLPHPHAAVAASLDIPPSAVPEPVVRNTFFFPDVAPSCIRAQLRLEHTVTPERLRSALCSAIAETNAELYLYRQQQVAAGYARLRDVPADTVDGESEKLFYYRAAVCSMVTALLYGRYRSVDASARGDKKADGIDGTIDEHWRDMRWAIARLQDKPRCIVGQL